MYGSNFINTLHVCVSLLVSSVPLSPSLWLVLMCRRRRRRPGGCLRCLWSLLSFPLQPVASWIQRLLSGLRPGALHSRFAFAGPSFRVKSCLQWAVGVGWISRFWTGLYLMSWFCSARRCVRVGGLVCMFLSFGRTSVHIGWIFGNAVLGLLQLIDTRGSWCYTLCVHRYNWHILA